MTTTTAKKIKYARYWTLDGKFYSENTAHIIEILGNSLSYPKQDYTLKDSSGNVFALCQVFWEKQAEQNKEDETL